MKTLQINEIQARSIYKNAVDPLRALLKDAFGEANLVEDVTERIKTFEDACDALSIPPTPDHVLKSFGLTDDEIAYRKIKIITKALNEGWEPDWDKGGQKKWVPWFHVDSSTDLHFSMAYNYYSNAVAGSGLRLCFKTEELAKYAGSQFTEIYQQFIL